MVAVLYQVTVEGQGDAVQRVGAQLLVPERLRNHAEHGAAVPPVGSVADDGDVESACANGSHQPRTILRPRSKSSDASSTSFRPRSNMSRLASTMFSRALSTPSALSAIYWRTSFPLFGA